MKRCFLVFLNVLLIGISAHAEGLSYDQLLTPDTCEHIWHPIVVSSAELTDGVQAYSYEVLGTKVYVSVGSYHAEVRYVMNRCSLCGLEQSMPEARDLPHCYRVTEELLLQDAVTLTYTCDDCGHARRETLDLAELRAEDPTSAEANCLHGGACSQAGLFTTAEIGRLTVLDGRVYYLTRVLVEEDGQLVTKVAQRLHCPFCRRPHLQHVRSLDEGWEGYAALPEMTYTEFMTLQTGEDLPYVVIDRLRNTQ